MKRTRTVETLTLALVGLTLLLAPFFAFEATVNEWVGRQFGAGAGPWVIALLVVTLLALDVFLPVPSSLVTTAAGANLGIAGGVAASVIGMGLGCVLGYAFGRTWGLAAARRLASEATLNAMTERFRRSDDWALAIARPVPVLAEASVIAAGLACMPLLRFFVITLLANVGIALVYCTAGAAASGAGSFFMAFAAAMGGPALAIWWQRRRMRRSGP